MKSLVVILVLGMLVLACGPEVRHDRQGAVKKSLSVQEKEAVPVQVELKGHGTSGVEWVFSKPAGVSFARSETTVVQYRACVEAGKCESKHHQTKSDDKYCNWGYGDRDDHPMNCVDWYGAEQFCEWAGGRVQTNGEWFVEATNGITQAFPWGNEEADCDRAIFAGGSSGDMGCGWTGTGPVCSKVNGHSASGLCDLLGNVWEWTWIGVARGGSWKDAGFPGAYSFLSRWESGRDSDPGSGAWPDVGFRCVRGPAKKGLQDSAPCDYSSCPRPEWADTPPVLGAVGIGRLENEDMARKLAEDSGCHELARQIAAKVMGILDQSAQQMVGAEPGELSGHQYVEEITRTLHKQFLSGSKPVPYWRDCCTDEWYALVTIDQEGLLAGANVAAKMAAQKILKPAGAKYEQLSEKIEEIIKKEITE